MGFMHIYGIFQHNQTLHSFLQFSAENPLSIGCWISETRVLRILLFFSRIQFLHLKSQEHRVRFFTDSEISTTFFGRLKTLLRVFLSINCLYSVIFCTVHLRCMVFYYNYFFSFLWFSTLKFAAFSLTLMHWI